MNNMVWKFNRNGVWEDVEPRRWVWGAVYTDGTELKQYGDDGIFHQIGEVEQDRLKMLVMYRLDDPEKRYDLVITEGMKIFVFYLNTKPYYLDEFITTTVFGYSKNGQKHYLFILPDDRVIVSDIENINLPEFNLVKRN